MLVRLGAFLLIILRQRSDLLSAIEPSAVSVRGSTSVLLSSHEKNVHCCSLFFRDHLIYFHLLSVSITIVAVVTCDSSQELRYLYADVLASGL